MVDSGNSPEIPSSPVPDKTSGRWDFLKKPFSRRKFLKGAALVVGAGLAAGGGLLIGSERSLQGEDETFKIGDEEVTVSWKEFMPKNQKDPSEVVLVLPGMPGRAKAPALWTLPEQLAEGFQSKTYMIDGRPKGNFHTNSIDLEVEGIRKFVEERGFKRISIVGHSLGSVKAANLAVSLQQHNPDLEIRGIALLNPMGLYAQSGGELVENVKVEFPNMARLANPNVPQQDKDPLQMGWQIVGSFSSEIMATGLGYPKLVREQIQALTRLNPKLSQVHAPVVVLVGKEDNLSQVQGIFPEPEIQAKLKQPLPSNQRLKMAAIGRARKQYLKEERFPEAENIEVIEASKFASHASFGERGVQTGRVLDKLFDRLKRPNTGVRAA